jgi:two-component system response regulator NreC
MSGVLAARSGSPARAVVDEPIGGASATIVLADDHALVRSGLRMLLEEAGFEIVAEAGDVPATVRKVRGYKPNVLVLDLSMPGGSSLAAIATLLEASPHTAIVVLTMHNDPAFAHEAIRAGAHAFVLKEAAGTELVNAVSAAVVGERYLNPQLGAVIAAEPSGVALPRDVLSDRQLEVLKLLALGYTNGQIARRLCLSSRTIESHRSHILRKTHCRSRAELVAYASEHNLIP